ncbi:histidine phosphatase family containing protein [Rhizoctonia solani AG-3 Rhs1AP]|nr:histidine phosphatase family containing protein [Rhizoctonia solani AG-3 Rhs1AP]
MPDIRPCRMPAWRRVHTLLVATAVYLYSTMITLTFVRHGESTDNLRAFWAGWADAALSNHGLNQAKAAAKFFSTYPITHMFASDLKRAHSTARAIYDAQPDPKPPLTITDLVREQHFGQGEGKQWGQGEWCQPSGRDGKFLDGESLNDVARRGDRFIETYLTRLIHESVNKPLGEVNVVVVSHGICIAETLGALTRRCVRVDTNGWTGRFRGLHNTAWTRVSLGVADESLSDTPISNGTDSNHRLTPDPGAVLATKLEESAPPPLQCDQAGPPLFSMKIIACNQHSHLNGVVRQKDGNQCSGDDPNEKKLREFFGGGGGEEN